MEVPSGKRVKATKTGTINKPVVEAETSDSPEKDLTTMKCENGPSSYWLMKSEPESRLEKGVDVKFGIEDLRAQPQQIACWDGVRNYQARNFLRAMKLGEKAFFYHSNCKEPGIAGLVKGDGKPTWLFLQDREGSGKAESSAMVQSAHAQPTDNSLLLADGNVRPSQIVKEAYPDHTQFEKNSPHYDPASKKDNPKWSMVDVQFIRMTKRFIPLAELKVHHQAHKTSGGPLENMALFTRQRLSVQPVTQGEFDFVLSLEDKKSS